MAIKNVHIKTITEVNRSTGVFSIHCFSDKKPDGTTTPSIFKAQVLEESKIIDNIEGQEGQLMLSYEGDTVGELTNGDLIIEPSDNGIQKYERGGDDNAYLIYTE